MKENINFYNYKKVKYSIKIKQIINEISNNLKNLTPPSKYTTQKRYQFYI